jgi:hypothetical protein
MYQYCAFTILESLIYAQYRKLQYSSSNNTGNTSIVKHTILEAPVFFIQQYCIVKNTILEAPVFFIQQYW